MVLGLIKFAVRLILVLFIIEYMAPGFVENGVETTAKAVGGGVANGLWSMFTTLGGHMFHH